MSLELLELAGADSRVRFSPHCWKVRMALAHKGLAAEFLPVYFTRKAALAVSGQDKVPVLVDGGVAVADSWRIAEHLERHYPDRPSLFGDERGRAFSRFISAWADQTLMFAIARLVFVDLHQALDPADQIYFRSTREKQLRKTIEEICEPRDREVVGVRKSLQPVRELIIEQPFLGGAAPNYADYCLFGFFMFARTVSSFEILEPTDPLHRWNERLLGMYDGMPRLATRAI